MTAPSFTLLMGLFYTGLAGLSMLPSLEIARDGVPYLFGLFAVSGPLTLVHVALGLWGLVAWSGALGAVGYARAASLLLALLALGGVAAMATGGMVALRGHNIWLHALTALAAAYFGFRSAARRPMLVASFKERRREGVERLERRRSVLDRRVAVRPVVQERRGGRADRRESGYGGSTLAAG